ncbi:hypothetical protein [Chachezhania sediminis]|uniref:hypothetical protein n=1 Tax=Chachezhania sediminis TaxID=2599291 RepID=UPI00131BEC17|nr:hypothetical protein [Chachezhania sediminis]
MVYAAIVAVILCVGETLRHAVFGPGSDEAFVVHGATLLGSLVILRGDVVSLFRHPRAGHYSRMDCGWTAKRSALGLVLGPAIWLVPIMAVGVLNFIGNSDIVGFSGSSAKDISLPIPVPMAGPLYLSFFAQALVLGLFFREAALKACEGRGGPALLLSTLSVFAFSLPAGGPAALMAAGLGLWLMTLRLSGVHLFCDGDRAGDHFGSSCRAAGVDGQSFLAPGRSLFFWHGDPVGGAVAGDGGAAGGVSAPSDRAAGRAGPCAEAKGGPCLMAPSPMPKRP